MEIAPFRYWNYHTANIKLKVIFFTYKLRVITVTGGFAIAPWREQGKLGVEEQFPMTNDE
jgi:hypothetical protein